MGNPKTVVVIGGTGFVGRRIVGLLVRQGYRVRSEEHTSELQSH